MVSIYLFACELHAMGQMQLREEGSGTSKSHSSHIVYVRRTRRIHIVYLLYIHIVYIDYAGMVASCSFSAVFAVLVAFCLHALLTFFLPTVAVVRSR